MRNLSVVRRIFLFSLIVGLVGCGSTTKNAVAGGVTGGVVGAGSGALVGTLISNGDVAASAALGGAVGVPVGIALGVVLTAYDSEAQQNKLLEEYRTNQEFIEEQQLELQKLREEVLLDKPDPDLNGIPSGRTFHGVTLGSHR